MIPAEQMPLVFSAISFIAIALFSMGIIQVIRNREAKKRIIDRIQEENPYNYSLNSTTAGDFRNVDGSGRAFLSFFDSFGRKLAPRTPEEYTRMKLRCYRCGIRHPNAPSIFWGIKGFLMVSFIAGFLFFRLTLLEPLNFQYSITVLVCFAVFGFYLPDMLLHMRSLNRKRVIFEGFPDALDLLVICVEAGMGLDASLARVGEEIRLSNKPLSDELKFLNLEIRAGKTREEALHNLALRVDIDDVRNLVTLLIQTDRFGTSIAKALRVYADTFRTKRFQRAEEIAAKLPVKMVFPLILLIFPSLFVVIVGPAAIRIYQNLIQAF